MVIQLVIQLVIINNHYGGVPINVLNFLPRILMRIRHTFASRLGYVCTRFPNGLYYFFIKPIRFYTFVAPPPNILNKLCSQIIRLHTLRATVLALCINNMQPLYVAIRSPHYLQIRPICSKNKLRFHAFGATLSHDWLRAFQNGHL